jgi:hypothetical protein
MLYAGLSLLPFAAIVAFLATRKQLSRAAVWAVIGVHPLGWTGMRPLNWPSAGRVPVRT